jgi:hypothetical protein
LIKGIEAVRNPKIENYYAVREEHKDGTPHYHVLMKFPKSCKVNIKNPRKFDIGGYHCNIQATRNRLAAWRYLHKPDGKSKHIGGDLKQPHTIQKEQKMDWWPKAVEFTNRSIFEEEFKRYAPRKFILNFNNIRGYMDHTFTPVIEKYESPKMEGNWTIPNPIKNWVTENLTNTPRKCTNPNH